MLVYNDAFVEALGRKHPAALGRPAREVWAEVWAQVAPDFERVRAAGAAVLRHDQRFVLLRGAAGAAEEAFYTFAFSPVRDEGGAVVGVFNTAAETTARVRGEAALSAERERLRSLVLHMPSPLALLEGPAHRFTLVNDAFRRVSGGGRDVTGLTPGEAFPELAGSGLFELHDRVYATGEPWVGPETLVRYDRDGAGVQDTWFDLRFEPVRDAGGRVTGILNFAVDVTDQVLARRAVEAERAAAERAAAALAESESRYRALFEALDAGFCVVEVLLDAQGSPADYRFLEGNPAFRAQTGLADPIGRTARELVPGLEQHWVETYGRVALTGEPARFEAGSAAMGREFTVHAFRAGRPEERRVAIFFHDVSAALAAERERERLLADVRGANDELRAASAAAREAERRSRFLAELGQALQPLTDPDELMATAARLLGEHVGADRCAYAEVEADEDHFTITGNYTRGDTASILGRFAFADFGAAVLRLMRANAPYVVEDAAADPRVTPPDRAAYARTQIRAVVCVPLHKAGRLVAAMAVHQRAPRRWAEDEVALVVTVVQRCWESLERARARRRLHEREAALAASERQFRTLADAIPTLAWTAQADGYIDWYNARWYEYTGTAPEQMAGWGWQSVHDPAVLPAVLERWQASVATGESFEMTFPLRGADGGFRPFLTRVLPLRDGEGRVVRWFGTNTDVTAERAAREAAEAANRAKSEFLAVMSHELRTPLNAIGGYAELIELGIHGPVTDAQRAALSRIQASQRHLLGLIAGVLDYSRVEAGAVTYRLADVPVGEAVAEAETLVAPQLRAKGLGYAWSGAPPELRVRADREKLQQVLLNLLGNAVKFTDARGGAAGRIEVACSVEDGGPSSEPDGGRVRLHVRDTGVGIAAEELERVFEPFVQADQTLTRPHAGVGLGLAISRDLARGMGGDLTVESEVGVGSTFTLTLPRA